jgi:hypothetical protein
MFYLRVVIGKSQEILSQTYVCLEEIEPGGSISPERPNRAVGFFTRTVEKEKEDAIG